MQPTIGDIVIKRTTSFQGTATYGGTTEVKSVYKNGNVVLAGVDGQHNVSYNRDEDYVLTPCNAPNNTGAKFVALSSATKADMQHSELMRKLNDILYEFEHIKRREQGFNAQDSSTLAAHIVALESILETLRN